MAQPERVEALVMISPGLPYVGTPQPHWVDTAPNWDADLADPEGWDLFNRKTLTEQHRRWVEFFFGEQLVEPHSTKPFEDLVGWALESDGAVLADSEEGIEIDLPEREEFRNEIARLGRPVLAIHGADDMCQSVTKSIELAELTGGEAVIVEGGGHLPHVKDPVMVTRAITGFVDRIEGTKMQPRKWTRGLSRRRKVLYVSSPIGLGHARRDVAVAKELRELEPDIQIDWLAQDPVTRILDSEGETIHPASEWLASESAHMTSEASEHDLHCFQALRNMDEILVANFMIFQEVVEEGLYDLVVADEAWEIDHFWHENPELKRGSHVWFTDFVGYLPMPSGGDHEAYLTTDYNAEMIEHIARYPRIRDRAIFVGNPDDVVPETFGGDLPKIREWTEDHFSFSGYITGFEPPDADRVAEWRDEVGFAADEKVVVVSVGGSGVGRALIEKVVAAHPVAKEQMPELRMLIVAGPRIEPDSLPEHEGLEIHGYVDRLYRHLSVCDLAVVQGGLTTTMELAAARRPFLYFPLRNHFEQNFHVRHRLDQYGAGRHMDFYATDPDQIAEAIVADAGAPVSYSPVETDGAQRAAAMIAGLI
jgi:predicted glycosyltransferase